MTVLAELKKALDRVAAARAEQAQIVADIEAPRRRLAEIEAAEIEAAAALAAAEQNEAQWREELADVRRWLTKWEPHFGKIASAIEVLETLEDTHDFSHLAATSRDFNHCRLALQHFVEYRDLRLNERARLETALRSLGVKV